MHQAEKTSKEIVSWVPESLPSSSLRQRREGERQHKNTGQTGILTDHHQKTLELRAWFNSESKSIFIRTIRRELKGLGLNSCAALRKPLISEPNRKKRFQFARERKDWTLEQWKKSTDYFLLAVSTWSPHCLGNTGLLAGSSHSGHSSSSALLNELHPLKHRPH
uniref:Transposase Tc1-like domain-containing protein n=1 Tax=Periophthalmus magnuspinnatus TaxID=409849 RepID=A0A3B4B4M1_9GOBI